MPSSSSSSPFVPALIVVDMQEDFCKPNGSLGITGGRELAPRINTLLSLPFALKVTTQDWHPPDSLTFASAHAGAVPFESKHTAASPSDPSRRFTWTLWPDHCVAGTAGASLIPELDAAAAHVALRKGLDRGAEVYSGFGDVFGRRGAHAADVDLGETLRARGVTHVYVVGLAGDHCVMATAVDAAADGYDTLVLEDCTRCVTEDAWKAARRDMEAKGISIVHSQGEEVRRVKEWHV